MKKKETKIISKIRHQDDSIKIREFSKTIDHYHSFKTNSILNNINSSKKKPSNISIIFKNLKKYSITRKRYNIYIINSIIFDQKNHLVAEFKNYLLWDETSEFLKRFYNFDESFDRLPNISQYYETYTLFSPIFFGLDIPIIIIMNSWVRRKKNYLEYLEDKEEKDEKKKGNREYFEKLHFKKIIESNLICSESSDMNSKNLKKTLELTKYDNIDSFFLKDNNNLSFNEKENEKQKFKITEDKKDISLSKIMDDLSSNYSVYVVNTYKNKKCEQNKIQVNSKKIKKESKKEINKKDKNIILSDKVLFSFSNLYKNRNKKYNYQKKYKYHYGTSNNSSSKMKKSQINEKNKDKKGKENNKSKYKIINPLNELKKSSKNKYSIQKNNLQITLINFTRNKTSIKEKKEKENIKKHVLTNTNTNLNVNSFNNSANNSLSRLKIKKQKLKKLYLRNLKIITQYNNYNAKDKSPISNTLDTNLNDNNMNIKKSKCNFTRLLTCKDGKFKKYLLNGNITNINLNNFNRNRFNKQNNTQVNYDPFNYKINKLIKEKKLISSTNSFSNNKIKINNNNNNSKREKKSSKNNINKINNFILLNKKLSNGNLIRNLVLSQFHSKKEIVHKSKNNFFHNNNATHHKMISSLSKHVTSRNNSLMKSKKINYTGKSNKRLNESLSIKPFKKQLNKINLNFNFNINFNIDINKNRKRRQMIANKNNLGFFTQRNPFLKGNKINKSKSRGGESSHRKNVLKSLIKNMKSDYNLRLKKNN